MYNCLTNFIEAINNDIKRDKLNELRNILGKEFIYIIVENDTNKWRNYLIDNINSNKIFKYLFEKGYKNSVEKLYMLSKEDQCINIDLNKLTYNDLIFAFENNHKEIIEWLLYDLLKNDKSININIYENSEYVFKTAYEKGYLEVAQSLLIL